MSIIESVNIALPREISANGSRPFLTGILKKPVHGPVYLGKLGFSGDGVGDKKGHGGEDKAVCAYFMGHFPYWENEYGRKILPGAFGENLTISGMSETDIHIGDIFIIGKALVQCSQPRQPCHKLNKVFYNQQMACQVKTAGFSGFYLRVIKPGRINAGMKFERIVPGFLRVSVAEVNRSIRKDRSKNINYKRILSVTALADEFRMIVRKKSGLIVD